MIRNYAKLVSWALVFSIHPAAGALTYVMVPDALLVDRATVVVKGRFASKTVGEVTGRVETSYDFDVSKVLKGDAPGSRLVVRVPGGIDRSKGLGVKIFGTPEFSPGDRALLFLAPTAEGAYRVLHIFQGAFQERLEGERRLYERPGRDRLELVTAATVRGEQPGRLLESGPHGHSRSRDAELFERWVSDRLAGVERPADYFSTEDSDDPQALASPFTYLAGEDFIFRWFDFDDGGKVRWHRHEDGQEGFPKGGGKEFKRARKAWSKKFSGVPIRLTNAGTTSSTTGFGLADSRNTVLFSDLNETIDDDFECPGGGVLAIGGLIDFDFLFTDWKGLSTLAAYEAEIVVNDGIDCFVRGDSQILAQIFAHELGHTLGLGHSCGDSSSPKCRKSELLAEALMAASLDDIFGAEIRDDDVLGARQLYDEEFWAAACEKKAPGGKKFCRKCGPCGTGQGNCKSDSDCFGSLVCARDVGADFGFEPEVNVCVEP